MERTNETDRRIEERKHSEDYACPACGTPVAESDPSVCRMLYGRDARTCRRCYAVYGGRISRAAYLLAWGTNGKIDLCSCTRGASTLRYISITIIGGNVAELVQGWACPDRWHKIG